MFIIFVWIFIYLAHSYLSIMYGTSTFDYAYVLQKVYFGIQILILVLHIKSFVLLTCLFNYLITFDQTLTFFESIR